MGEKKTEDDFPITFESCIDVDGKLWFTGRNLICSMSLPDGTIEVSDILCRDMQGMRRHEAVLQMKYGKRLIFTPEYTNRIIDYDTVTGERREILFDCPEREPSKRSGGPDFKFNSTVQVDQDIWFIPTSSKRLLRYSPETGETHCYPDWYEDYFSGYDWQNLIFGRGKLVLGKIIFSCQRINAFCVFDPVEETMQVHFWGAEKNRANVFFEYKNQLWLIDTLNREIQDDR